MTAGHLTVLHKLKHNVSFASVWKKKKKEKKVFHLSVHFPHSQSSVKAVVHCPSAEPQHSLPLRLIDRSKHFLPRSVSQNSGVYIGGNLSPSLFPSSLSVTSYLTEAAGEESVTCFITEIHKHAQDDTGTVEHRVQEASVSSVAFRPLTPPHISRQKRSLEENIFVHAFQSGTPINRLKTHHIFLLFSYANGMAVRTRMPVCPPLWYRLKCLNSCCTDCQETHCKHLLFVKDNCN